MAVGCDILTDMLLFCSTGILGPRGWHHYERALSRCGKHICPAAARSRAVLVIGMYLLQHASAEHHIPVSGSEDQISSFSAQSCTNYNLVYISFLVKFGYGQDVANGMNLAFHSIAATGPEITQVPHSYLPCLNGLLT